MQQQHQYNARAWNEQKRESMDSSSSSFIIILHMQQQQNAKSMNEYEGIDLFSSHLHRQQLPANVTSLK